MLKVKAKDFFLLNIVSYLIIYYDALISTKIIILYDLIVTDEYEEKQNFKDIYRYQRKL